MSVERRSPFIDYLKAAAIVAVVAQHAIVPRWVPNAPIEDRILRPIVQFHVPAFLFASGFLYYSATSISVSEVLLRIRRVLPAFLVASLFWILYMEGSDATLEDTLWLVATAEALPIYYYVHLILECIVFSWVISRLPPQANIGLFVLLLLAGASLNWFPQYDPLRGLYGQMRNPLIYTPFFVAGWASRQHSDWFDSLCPRDVRWAGITALAVLIALLVVYYAMPTTWGSSWILFRALFSLAIVALIASLCAGSGPAPRAIVFLSAAGYTIYLYHFPVVIRLQQLMMNESMASLRIALLTVTGIATGSALALAGSKLLGRRSADLLGTYWK